MKILALTLSFLLLTTTFVFAQDRIRIQIQFRKGIFACPSGNEIVDFNMNGGNTYAHTCKDGTWLNSFKEYNGALSYTPKEYELLKPEDIATAKQELVDKWLYDVKHPAPYIEPTVEQLQQEIDMKMQEIQSLGARKIVAQAKIGAIIIDR